jgi:hypothetical protein
MIFKARRTWCLLRKTRLTTTTPWRPGAVARLQKRLDSGKAALKHDESFGYLLSVLDQLKVPKSSQNAWYSRKLHSSAN